MKTRIQVAIVVALGVVAVADGAPPPGYTLLADSFQDFSDVQGQAGWRYRFDRGDGTPVEDMQYYLLSYGAYRWCATPNYGGSSGSPDWSHCMLAQDASHTNSAGDCNTPAQGVLRPIREWTGQPSGVKKVHLTLSPATSSSGMRFDLLANGAVIWSQAWYSGNLPPADVWIDVASAQSITLRCDPLGSCGSDMAAQRVEIYGACAGDLNADAVIDGSDLGILLAFWGPVSTFPRADLDGDGKISGSDLGLLLANWGPCQN